CKRGNLKVGHGGTYWMNGCGTAPGSAGGTEAPWAEEAAWVGFSSVPPTQAGSSAQGASVPPALPGAVPQPFIQ
ncbi:hypothetical protein ACGNXG_00130, partial [Pseudomonas aeruginosa]